MKMITSESSPENPDASEKKGAAAASRIRNSTALPRENLAGGSAFTAGAFCAVCAAGSFIAAEINTGI
jgi:hypothetical protein